MAQPDTVDRILDTAERLFAEKGFAETSLRTITGRAGVNLAAVNYHFGSKKTLIQAVFERFLTPFCAALDAAIDQRLRDAGRDELSLQELLELIARTAIELTAREPERGIVFMRLIGLAYNESQGHLRRYLATEYGQTFLRLRRLVARAVPDVAPTEMFWRVHFALGAVIFTLSGLSSLVAIAESDFGQRPSFEEVAAHLLPFVTGGMLQRGPVSS